MQAVEHMTHLAVETPDSGWMYVRAWDVLLTPAERNQLIDAVRTELAPQLSSGEYWFPEERDDDDPVEHALHDYMKAFEDAGDRVTAALFEEALDAFRELPVRLPEGDTPDEDSDPEHYWDAGRGSDDRRRSSLVLPPKPGRSVFDDIDG